MSREPTRRGGGKVPPPTPTRGTRVGVSRQAQLDDEAFQLGGTSETRVEETDPRPPVPVPEERGKPFRSSTFAKGLSLEDLVGDEEEIEEHVKGYGPAVVILHDGVMGPGSGAGLSRGRVVRLSQLLGDAIMQGLERKDPSARKQLAHYMAGDDPAVRAASEEEAQYDEIAFTEGEEALEEALDAQGIRLRVREAENARLRELIRTAASDPNFDFEAALADIDRATGGASIMGRRNVTGASDASRMNPDEPTPEETGETASGRDRDPGFVKQGQESIRDSASPGPGDTDTAVQGGNVGQETEEFETEFPGEEETGGPVE